jgi:hypothetical protein
MSARKAKPLDVAVDLDLAMASPAIKSGTKPTPFSLLTLLI